MTSCFGSSFAKEGSRGSGIGVSVEKSMISSLGMAVGEKERRVKRSKLSSLGFMAEWFGGVHRSIIEFEELGNATGVSCLHVVF